MIGITAIGAYVADQRVESSQLLDRFGVDESFLDKIGIRRVARMAPGQGASDLCVGAFEDLLRTRPDLDPVSIECICVCTQNGDHALPHTSAIVHGKLDLPEQCTAFDLGLGCSGYVYGLSVLKGFMEENGFTRGVLFTADPYSLILDPEDKNTSLLFGDGATATLLDQQARFSVGKCVFSTFGVKHDRLIKRAGEPLFMDGREIFNFAMRHVPSNVDACLHKNGCPSTEVDKVILHQANRYIVDNMKRRLGMPNSLFPYSIEDYGNTISSTIPLVLSDEFESHAQTLLLVGFGVGLSIASTLLRRL